MGDWKEKLDSAWTSIKRKAGQCAANTDLEDLKSAVQLTSGRIDQVLYGGQILQGDSAVFEKLTAANKGLTAIGESLEKVQDICMDISAVGKIHDAVKVLSNNQIIYNDPQAAADAFDSMFQGFGRLCRHLPPPANVWGQFFESFNLFGNMQKKVYAPYFKERADARDQKGIYQQ